MSDDGLATPGPGLHSGPGRGRGWWDWWHHSHPTFAALTGFYVGLVFIILAPSTFAAILTAVVDDDRVGKLYPLVLLTLLLPLALLVPRKTRRFAEFVWLGIVSTAIVVGGVAALVLWILIDHT
ncbi:MAG: hypothetical protein QM638_07770 [Nocardioides sp.]|uniref:hypothetical protein n=1 Tax=Nocardioides sp. TaxID=35761 RepID=UPI0039E2C5FA